MLEVCVEDGAGMAAALAGGADRLELCVALDLGGLTPPSSLLDLAARQPLPVHALSRPRPGDFAYNARDCALVQADLAEFAKAGLAGAVIGCGGRQGLDRGALAEWVDHARALGEARGRPLSLTLHRVFDLLDDPFAGLEIAVELGFDRILTSAGAVRAGDGVARFAALVKAASGRITIMAGGGLEPAAVAALRAAGVHEFHASCRSPVPKACVDARLIDLGFQAGRGRQTDVSRVAAFVAATS
ncbi:copper homeostasis protein [Novosphingobium capsulatum]|uniref:Copper homeostasis protein cutC homolog n=1 Tax=Novosphingobium capsulatum TaxID=13688 RepID=A0ABU1MQH4_9SPHN|nr:MULTISPECIES: copper homeostasis protein CutC [Novosphingobium]MBB3356426.1 copper homeostasis protein [Novosphingobium sp. BK256]MBB3372827.1 copper homeostasis protein [Novosphingobium sp. BK280]MBB3377195.1 copper homeostasis protein [Novosphingobium sp. BK258]MBB3419394.1 copper homeostasis protein [Novosphingobium sp. BK267]MBB3448789.1 copper homeostasis protein [Novosphingobium sp. BK352]